MFPAPVAEHDEIQQLIVRQKENMENENIKSKKEIKS